MVHIAAEGLAGAVPVDLVAVLYALCMVAAKNVLETFRDVVQDLLVPELKAVKVSVDSLRDDMKELRSDIKQSNETMRDDMRELRSDVKLSTEVMREEMKLRHDNLERMITHGDQRNEQLIRSLAEKFDVAVEMRERLASIEARLPRQ